MNLIYDETHMRGYRNSFNTILENRGGGEGKISWKVRKYLGRARVGRWGGGDECR
jgi:hypothetical protein